MRLKAFWPVAAVLSAALVASSSPASEVPSQKSAVMTYALGLLNETRFQAPEGWQWGSFRNADNASLRYGWSRAKNDPIGTVVILPGFNSPIETFFETTRDFQKAGFDVWILDWRGQGGSDRWLPDREKSYSEGLDRDERDALAFVSRSVHPRGPMFIVGESFGGHIGLRFLHDHAQLVRGAAFSSPAIAFQTGDTPAWLARLSAWLAVNFGYGANYALDQHNWSFNPNAGAPSDPVLDDRDRGLSMEAWELKDSNLRQGGATWAYVHAFFQSTALEMSPGWMGAIRTPVLLGEVPGDKIAVASVMAASCHAMPNCGLLEYAHTKHALFADKDPERADFIAAIVRFFRLQASKGVSQASRAR